MVVERNPRNSDGTAPSEATRGEDGCKRPRCNVGRKARDARMRRAARMENCHIQSVGISAQIRVKGVVQRCLCMRYVVTDS